MSWDRISGLIILLAVADPLAIMPFIAPVTCQQSAHCRLAGRHGDAGQSRDHRPAETEQQSRVAIVVDGSASMQASDVDGFLCCVGRQPKPPLNAAPTPIRPLCCHFRTLSDTLTPGLNDQATMATRFGPLQNLTDGEQLPSQPYSLAMALIRTNRRRPTTCRCGIPSLPLVLARLPQ